MAGNSAHIFQKTQVSLLQKQLNESVETEIRTIFGTHQSFLYLRIPTPRGSDGRNRRSLRSYKQTLISNYFKKAHFLSKYDFDVKVQ